MRNKYQVILWEFCARHFTPLTDILLFTRLQMTCYKMSEPMTNSAITTAVTSFLDSNDVQERPEWVMYYLMWNIIYVNVHKSFLYRVYSTQIVEFWFGNLMIFSAINFIFGYAHVGWFQWDIPKQINGSKD